MKTKTHPCRGLPWAIWQLIRLSLSLSFYLSFHSPGRVTSFLSAAKRSSNPPLISVDLVSTHLQLQLQFTLASCSVTFFPPLPLVSPVTPGTPLSLARSRVICNFEQAERERERERERENLTHTHMHPHSRSLFYPEGLKMKCERETSKKCEKQTGLPVSQMNV